ncbi:transmembrane protein 156 [Ctenodactylus gundi]
MTKTSLFRLLVAIVIMFILSLPEYFKTPNGRILELSCPKESLQSNFTYSLLSLNFCFVTFLQPVRDTQAIVGISFNHSNSQNFTRTYQDITSEFITCSSCWICESKGSTDLISQNQTSKDSTCSMKITWYILVLSVFAFIIIFIIHKIFEDLRRMQKWQSHTHKPTPALLRAGSDAETRRALDARVISEPTQGLPLAGAMEVLPPIPELEVTSVLHQ